MTLIRDADSTIHAKHELLKLRSFAIVLSGLAYRDKSDTAVIKSLSQYRKSFDSIYNVLFQKARRADILRDLALSCSLQGVK